MTPNKNYEDMNELLVNTDYHIREVETETKIFYQLIHENKSGIEIIIMTFLPSDFTLLVGFFKAFSPILDLSGKNHNQDLFRLHEINESRVKMIDALGDQIEIYEKTIAIQGDKIRELTEGDLK